MNMTLGYQDNISPIKCYYKLSPAECRRYARSLEERHLHFLVQTILSKDFVTFQIFEQIALQHFNKCAIWRTLNVKIKALVRVRCWASDVYF